jgi:cobalt/nickel transport system ATP-binding protein
LGISHLLDRAPFHLSGGEKRKVSLATALMLNPDVLLLDEPTAGLDPRTQAQLVEVLDHLHHAGKAIVTATHDLSLATRLADRCIVLGEGHSIEVDRPTQQALNDTELLLRVNLIHPNSHWHGEIFHTHTHAGQHNHDGNTGHVHH